MKLNLNTSNTQVAKESKSVQQSQSMTTSTKSLKLTEQENVSKSSLKNQDLLSTLPLKIDTLADKVNTPILPAPVVKSNSLQGLINGDLEKQDKAIAIPNKEELDRDSMSLSGKLSTSLVCNSPTHEIAPIESVVNNIPQVTTEKYKLLAEATDTLTESTIKQFEERMQAIIDAFDNTNLHDAMKRVLEYTQEHNELRTFLRAEDIQIFVRGARQSYAMVAKVKTTNRSKKTKSVVLDANAIEDLADLEIEL